MNLQRWSWRNAALVFAGWTLVVLIFSTVSYGASLSGASRGFAFLDALRLNIVQFYLWGILSIGIFRFSRRFPIELRPLRLRNVLFHLPALIAFATIHQVLHIALVWLVMPRIRHQFPSIAACYRAFFGLGFYIDLIIASLIMIAAHAVFYYRRFHASQVEQSSLKAQLAEAQLKALKMQLQPHFLFNTLHAISSLVLEDPPRANEMIARLGEFLRLTLEHSEEQLVTVKEETEFLRCYLEIEQVRFGDRLAIEYQIEPAVLSAYVPQLILQPVVENAIEHGVAPRAAVGRVTIAAHRRDGVLRIEIVDNGPGASDSSELAHNGVGLSNVRTRLTQLYGAACSLQTSNRPEGGFSVVMEIPFRSDPELTA